ncbi:hypothetical protein I6A84_01345 [Frankia sp. CNm7]|uniref:Uncharacterized protein n=1 Tax=Frankia nepalensis TaxID=1836974 RepID=A0A937RCA2_9ACTN|nr:hypothetical protein [Frankia nepalensis]MBL7498011.1 hypothetical protein [Frankia nepalensis]MBL7509093.1 hypothetical protein [Frankia nepalensis]MBL7516804.1 hypothetical protein [Frankia nepalensis]MBL7627800.1 hypothetical protein [Frankia nepalensis]
MINGIGSLQGADEQLNHQIVDTFATVSQSDLSWTEKIWGSLARTDGTLQIDFGLGRYHNRGIVDGFGGVSRGREQWTVRASRELGSAPEATDVGPLEYEILDPLRKVRFRLLPNDVQPISFDVVLSGVTPPFFEDRNLVRNPRNGRVEVDVIRYHQGGWLSGTITVEGVTHEVRPQEWFGFRDHSWGVRQAVGAPPTDLRPKPLVTADGKRGGFKWSPAFFQRPDETYYETALHVIEGGPWTSTSAYLNDSSGHQEAIRAVEPRIEYDPRTRFVRGGELIVTMESGERRIITVEALGESGFFLKTAGYGDWAGHKHGAWMGPLHVDGEYIPDCWDEKHLRLLGQLRDTPIRVREGDAVGYGIMESMMSGEWPELGLTAASDHRVSYM